MFYGKKDVEHLTIFTQTRFSRPSRPKIYNFEIISANRESMIISLCNEM